MKVSNNPTFSLKSGNNVSMFYRYILIIFCIIVGVSQTRELFADVKDKNISELLYKNSLFHYYSGDYITALTKTLINEQQSKIDKHQTKNKLLLGGIYLAYGLDYDAKHIFETMHNSAIDEETRNIIWFYIGRDLYHNFDYENAETSLEKMSQNISRKNKLDKENILSNVYVHNNNVDDLSKLLASKNQSDESSDYLRFNLGIAYLRNNSPDMGKKYLLEVANIKPTNFEQASLRDKAKLHLANIAFKDKDYKSTIKYTDEINANGLYSESAIYLSALSYSIIGNTKKAYSLLTALKLKDSKNIYKYYSILLIARILEQNGELDEALQVLNNGVQTIKSEKDELNVLLTQIRNDFFLTDLAKNKNGEIIVTNEKYEELVNDLTFNKEFSGLYNHYIDLIDLTKTTRHWNTQIPEYYIMLKERDNFFKTKKTTISISQYQDKKSRYQTELDKNTRLLSAIKTNKNIEALYTDEEIEVSDDLDAVSNKIKRLSKHQDLSDYSEKIRIMKGLNYWGAAQQYDARLWTAKINLTEMENEIKLLDKRITSLEKAAKSEFNYSYHKSTVDTASSRLKLLDAKLNNTISRLKEKLIKLASQELDHRFKDIDSYYRAFKFDVARVSDRIVVNKNP